MKDTKNEINDPLTSHEYDGIQEYDNPLPNWWLMTFFGTIIFAFVYWLHYEIGDGPSLKTELDQAMVVLANQHAQAPKTELSEGELQAKMKDPGLIAGATATFETKCAACHGKDLQGVVGPNLTDAFWLHGKGSAKDILEVVKKGVPEKGMPPWADLLSSDEAVGVVAYILSKQDSNPAQAKAPQGEKVR